MAFLKSGVLVKLLEDMDDEEKGSEDDRKPVLLQIRSIIPVLEEGDLWPNRGFYLKVSDMSHALYVSLPSEENDMILGNKVKLGQYVYVQKLEKAQPVPTLIGITPVPGRRPCDGSPEDLISVEELVNFFEASDAELIEEKGVISERKIFESSPDTRKLFHESSDSEILEENGDNVGKGSRGRFRSSSVSRRCLGEQRFSRGCGIVDNDSDSDSTTSSVSSTRISKRRSWNESEILKVKEIFDSSSVVKREIKPKPCRSATVSPVRSARYDSSDDNSSFAARKRVGGSKKLIRSSNKNKIPLPKVYPATIDSPVKDVKCANTGISRDFKNIEGADASISWDLLPPSLVKLGKDTVRNRDVAVVAAGEALQEACAAERLIKCLSIFSEFQLAEGNDMQPSVDRFFDLQDELARTRLIMQSLTDISPLRIPGTDSGATSSVKEALNLALERKKNAASWIKSAVALDLSPLTSLQHITTMVNTDTLKKLNPESVCTKPKGASIVRKQRMNGDIPILFAADKDGQLEWMRGSTLCAAADLATSLQDECRKFFLGYVEKYLEEIENQTSVESDSNIAALMYKVKRVNDWLDLIIHKEANPTKDEGKEGLGLDQSEMEACKRVKNKIYGILWKNVERTAMVLESMNASSQDSIVGGV